MGVDPKIWGPYMWTALHLICEGAPSIVSSENRQHYAAFFAHLAHVLPCTKCAHHLQSILEKHPLDESVQTREHLIGWCIKLHTLVAADINPGASITEAVARRHWEAVAKGDKPAFPSVCTLCKSHAGAPNADSSYGAGKIAIALLIIVVVGGISYAALSGSPKKKAGR